VFVKKDCVDETPDVIQHWVARILEVRAGDAVHVYLRVFWLYRPEDLRNGRQPHHGSCELIVSNHVDIIEACTVQSAADVVHWDQNLDGISKIPADQLYWRQSLNIFKEEQLSVRNVP
jgi:hypothetical protein